MLRSLSRKHSSKSPQQAVHKNSHYKKSTNHNSIFPNHNYHQYSKKRSSELAVYIIGVISISAVLPAPVSEEVVDALSPAKTGGHAILNAYSKSNDTESTYEEIMEEIAARKAEQSGAQTEDAHTIKKR